MKSPAYISQQCLYNQQPSFGSAFSFFWQQNCRHELKEIFNRKIEEFFRTTKVQIA